MVDDSKRSGSERRRFGVTCRYARCALRHLGKGMALVSEENRIGTKITTLRE